MWDEFIIDYDIYRVYGINGDLFEPKKLNLHPIGMCSSCWKGYIIIYSYHDDKLFLNRLEINLLDDFEHQNPIIGPKINGVLPELTISSIRWEYTLF